MARLTLYISFALLILVGCDSQKKAVENTTGEFEQTEVVNPNTDLALAGAVNFDDEESLSIYAAILKNVIGEKSGAYIGHYMDKLAGILQNDLNYSELLRAGEGLILEFNSNSDLYFDSGQTSLNTSSKATLDKLIAVLGEHSKVNLIIETHTDDTEDEDLNMKITSRQSTAIKNYLLDGGIESARITTKAFGDSQPRFENDSTENRQKNTRIDFGFYASESLKQEAQNMTD